MIIDDGDLGFGGDSDHNMCFVTLKDYYVVKSILSNATIKRPTWNIKEDQDYSDYSKVIDKYLCKVDKTSVHNFASSVSSLIHRSMLETIGLKTKSLFREPHTLPPEILAQIGKRRILSKNWKILQKQHQRDLASIPSAAPTQTLGEAFKNLENQNIKVKNLISDYHIKERNINIESCKGNSKSSIKKFWSFVTNKEKKSSHIKSLYSENSGVLKCSVDEILQETVQYVQNLFEGQFLPFSEKTNLKQPVFSTTDHNYSVNFSNTPPPPNPGKENNSDHIYSAPAPPCLVSFDESKTCETDPIGFLNADFNFEEIKYAISLLKRDKARGWDDIPNECLKYTSPKFQTIITELFNMIKNSDDLPYGWNHGRLVLIHKRGPVEMIINYRPLTVNISLSGLYSRVLNDRLSCVVESHNLLGEIQSVFRKGRSGADNNFVLNTIMWKAKAEGKEVHKAYIDIHKAYDSVNRKKLWAKLRSLQFGEQFVKCIENLHHDDCIRTEHNGFKSRPIYLARGVRQGCSLSPLLFAIYLSDMSHDLTNSTNGFMLTGTCISALFFC